MFKNNRENLGGDREWDRLYPTVYSKKWRMRHD